MTRRAVDARAIAARALARARDPKSRAAAVYLGATILARAGAIFLIPLYTRALDRDEYGVLALGQTLVGLLATPLSLGLNSSVVREYYAGGDAVSATARAGSVARWMVAVTLLSAGTLAAFATPLGLDGLLGPEGSARLVLLAAAGSALGTIPVVVCRAAQKPLRAAAFQLGEFASSLGAGLTLVLGLGRGLRGALEALAVSGAFVGLVALVFVFARLPGRFDASVVRGAMRFSVPLVPHGVANQLQQISDRWVLRFNGLEAALGTYALAGQLSIPVSMAVNAWNEAITPAMGEVYREGRVRGLLAALPRFIRGYALSAIVPAALVIAALPALWLVLGERFASSIFLVPVLCAILALECGYYPLANVLFFANRPDTIVRITVGAGLANVALNVAMIPILGVWGAFVARLMSMAARTVAVALAVRSLAREAP